MNELHYRKARKVLTDLSVLEKKDFNAPCRVLLGGMKMGLFSYFFRLDEKLIEATEKGDVSLLKSQLSYGADANSKTGGFF